MAVVLGAGAWAATSWRSDKAVSASPASALSRSIAPGPPSTSAPAPLSIDAIAPQPGTKDVAATASIDVTVSTPLSPSAPNPELSPSWPGQWVRTAPDILHFAPASPFPPGVTVTVTVPAGPTGLRGSNGATLSAPASTKFTVAVGSTLRLQQLLAMAGYLPLTWTPTATVPAAGDTVGQAAAAVTPPVGNFAWSSAGWPSSLTGLWQQGSENLVTRGAVMAFQSAHQLSTDGVAGPQVWTALLASAAAGQTNTSGYTYALTNKASPETLTVWHNGAVAVRTAVNTGISAAPTADGTFPVYERLRQQTMRGSNPDGSTYADPVEWVAYFNGGDAVHYIPRSTFGSPQSLGCVEVPYAAGAQAWPLLTYGTLVTVAG
ncbi:MAG: L,D-transpeptidase family protein [Actinomycetota bacterium]|nr:L,D-transpeptidase family protein [Actinomycetota bacterium]MDQ6945164.1 L,D-transpeptidase family protein [Actinomycetota bacterium]